MLSDLRFGVRMLGKNLGFTAIAAVAMALGIGANTAVFSVVDALLWKPLPFLDLDRLVMLAETDARRPGERNEVSPADFLDWRAQATTLDHLAAFWTRGVNLAGEADPEMIDGCRASHELFSALGVAPAMGRTILPEEEQDGRNHVAVLSHALWTRRFAADPKILGKTIQMEGLDHEVIGVMPRGFDFPRPVEVWTPLVLSPAERTNRSIHFLSAVARLKPGMRLAGARAEMSAIAGRLERQYPASNRGRGVRVAPLREMVQSDMTRNYSLMLLGAVSFVLLIACSNVANLQYVHAGARVREIAVRAAIGASRWRVIRMLIAQSVMLSLIGCGLGLLLGMWGADLLKSGMPPEVERYITGWNTISLDGRVLAFTVLAAVLSGIAAGLAPAWQFSRPDLNEELKEGGRGATSGRARHRMRNALVIAEISLALVLMTGAGLLVKGFRGLAGDAGRMRPESLIAARVQLAAARYTERPEFARFAGQALERFQTLPGVEAAAVVTSLPLGQSRSSYAFEIEGKAPPAPGVLRIAQVQSVSPGYFRVMQIPLRAGRPFDRGDGADAQPVAIISEELKQRYFAGEDPIGQRVRAGPNGPWARIVGVVGGIRHSSTEKQIRPVVYRPYDQQPTRQADFVVRAGVSPASLYGPLRSQIASIDRGQPVTLKAMERVIAEERVGLAYVATMMGVMGVIALMLAAVGVYGVMAFSVTERTHEIGVRMALGALPRDVLSIVVGGGLRLACTGLAVGLALAWLLARALASLIFGVSATDAATFSGVSLFLILVALAACYVPARRAAGVDPMVALRHE